MPSRSHLGMLPPLSTEMKHTTRFIFMTSHDEPGFQPIRCGYYSISPTRLNSD